MKKNLKKIFKGIAKSRDIVYQQEVDRQKDLIKKAFEKWLSEEEKYIIEGKPKPLCELRPLHLRFDFSMDEILLPEVEDFIKKEFSMEVTYDFDDDFGDLTHIWGRYEL